MDIEKIVAAGTSVGYTGLALQAFVKEHTEKYEQVEKDRIAREERLFERERKAEERRWEKEKRELELKELEVKEKMALERDREKEKMALERDREKEKMALEKEKMALEREKAEKKMALENDREKEKIALERDREKEKMALEREKVEKKMALENDREKEKMALERDREKEKMVLESDREKEKMMLESDRERDKLAYEKEKEQDRLAFERVKLDQQDQIERQKLTLERERIDKGIATGVGHGSGSLPKMPKMPPFEDQKDSIDAYLQRFERVALVQKWPEENWAAYLCTLLKGKALEVYTRLSRADAEDYTQVKAALLKRYEMTEEGFHQKFRNAKVDNGEIFSQFVVRIENYLTRWIELSGTEKSYDGVIDLLLREQILNVVGRDLSLFLKERKPNDAVEMAKLAEQYLEARGPVSSGKSGSYKSGSGERHNASTNNKSTGDQRSTQFQANRRLYLPLHERTCFRCKQVGHIAATCKNPPVKLASIQVRKPLARGSLLSSIGEVRELSDHVSPGVECGVEGKCQQEGVATGSMDTLDHCMPIHLGKVNGKPIDVLRDSGCNGVIVRRSLVSEDCVTSDVQPCRLADSRVLMLPVAWIEVDTPFYQGKLRAACMDTPLCDLILGNVPGVREPSDPDLEWGQSSTLEVNAVETRGQRKVRQEGMKPLKILQTVSQNLTREEFVARQQQDPSLDKVRKLIKEVKVRQTATGTSHYHQEGDMLYRTHTSTKVDGGKSIVQAVVPCNLRLDVMQVCHESLMGGHLGAKKTLDRVTSQFYWPGVMGDVRRHVMSCDICQRTIPKGKVKRVPLGQMPLIEVPFERIAVDLVGPLYPVTDKGNRYILTVVDYATRYPEAVPLPRIETEYVAEALFEIFSRVGIPKEILTDMGSQFTSGIMREVSRLLSLHQLTTTPYHPMCNGLVERFNGTLKTMLKRMCSERPQDWDRYLPALLFAYREVPQESLGFAPFELLYGRTVRGPVQILREVWTKEIKNPEVRSTYEYVLDLQNRLEETLQVAQQELRKSQGRYKRYYNAKSRIRKMLPGEKVLVLLPTDNNKLLMQWKGPFDIVDTFGVGNYRVQVGTKVKTYHANLLKKYIARVQVTSTSMGELRSSAECDVSSSKYDVSSIGHDVSTSCLMYVGTGLVDVGTEEISTLDIRSPPLVAKETYKDVDISEALTAEQHQQVSNLVYEYRDVLSDLPGQVDCMEYEINLTCTDPVRSRPYPLPHHMRDVVRKEVQTMLELGVIEPSKSPYASPVVLVKKPDSSYRFCIDFRKLNQITVFDSEPIPLAEALFARLANCKYFTKIDISKAYWQIPMEPGSKELTAFVTPDGLYQWKVMPFGVVNAPAVFSRLMRQVLQGVPDTDNYIDDILEGTVEWDRHMVSLRAVFDRLRQFHLTARPSKVKVGYSTLDFLGHRIGEGHIQPEAKNVDKILKIVPPTTKKQVRALIGLTSYYRKFIPNFAAIAVPLTELTKKGKPNHVEWTESQDRAFQTLRRHMSTFPILRLPDLTKQFLVRTDASDLGLGAVLLQEQEGECFPITYVSRKLLDREKAYSTVEKECLAIVWAVQKLERYLYGREFVLETDHQPLVWMAKAKLSNGRVMRWALALQPFRFVIRAVRGADNVGADLLSRCSP